MHDRRRQLTAAAAAAALLWGCGSEEPATPATPVATDACDAVEFPAVQFGSHLLGDTDPPVPYSSTPPTSGWHTSGAIPQGIFDEPLPEPAQVSVLEAGGVVVTHNGLDAEELAQLVAAAEGPLADRIVVTPYDGIPEGATAFTSWGAVQRCDGVDVAALTTYADTYAEPAAPHH